MLIENPVRESYEEIREKYDGYCVLVIECDKEKMDFGTGKAIAYGDKLAALTKETRDIISGDVGIFMYCTFTDFGGFGVGPIQVTHHV
jgi:hypothetical protein